MLSEYHFLFNLMIYRTESYPPSRTKHVAFLIILDKVGCFIASMSATINEATALSRDVKYLAKTQEHDIQFDEAIDRAGLR
jgi:hypothetical protein